MNEATQDAWFFTRDGVQEGPVMMAELRGKAREGGLNPRLDMVWTQGMADWKPAGEIEDLFEKRATAEPQEALAPAADPYQPPQSDESAGMLSQEGGWPGARRRSFYLMTVLFPFVWNFGFAFGAALLAQQFGPEIMGVATIGAAFVPLVVAILFWLMILLVLLMIAAFVAIMFGAINHPELRQIFEEAMRPLQEGVGGQ